MAKRLYVWFDTNAGFENGGYNLGLPGTVMDLAAQGIELHEGLALTLYSDDADLDGQLEWIMVDVVVARDGCGFYAAVVHDIEERPARIPGYRPDGSPYKPWHHIWFDPSAERGPGNYALNHARTVEDLAARELELRDGLALTLYCEGMDAQDQPIWRLLDVVVARDADGLFARRLDDTTWRSVPRRAGLRPDGTAFGAR